MFSKDVDEGGVLFAFRRESLLILERALSWQSSFDTPSKSKGERESATICFVGTYVVAAVALILFFTLRTATSAS